MFHSQLSLAPLFGPELLAAAQPSVVSPGLESTTYGMVVSSSGSPAVAGPESNV